ncbi:Hexosyltransferase [Sarracenia purpurea var. burkii]
MDDGRRVLVVVFPGQGLLNPSLQFAKRLAKMGVKVTFFTAFSALNRMPNNTIPVPPGVTVVGFSDGYDDGFAAGYDTTLYVSELRRLGSQAVRELLKESSESGRPFARVIYTTLLFWVAEVARNFNLPSTLLWVQPATVLDIYYFYFNGYGDSVLSNHGGDLSPSVELPGLPPLASGDLPSYLISLNKDTFALPMFKEHIEVLESEKSPKILVNSFDALEAQALRAIEKFKLVGIGPLLPSAFLDGKDPSDTSFGGDLFRKSGGCVEWLSSKADGSVVYLSFGSVCVVSKQQKEEIAGGLLASRLPFLWVIREGTKGKEDGEEEGLSCIEELEEQGMIVPWCSQVEVLSHPSLGCFVTHCGWNSTLEGIISGVPMVAIPQWSDQATNAKLIQDVWKIGVRVAMDEQGVARGKDITKCLEMVMSGEDKAKEMKRNAEKWKGLAKVAVKEGGSSDVNLKAFLNDIWE